MFEDWISLAQNAAIQASSMKLELEDALLWFIHTLEESVLDELISSATDAMQSLSEYNNPEARPLVDQFLNNLLARDEEGRPVHVRVSINGDVKVFNEEFAGTYEDLIAGQRVGAVGKITNPQSIRYRFWKYGIYMPDVEGRDVPSYQEWFEKGKAKLPSYHEIIHARLSAWGDKAPYWYFIEYGNVSLAKKAYPLIRGTRFIYKTRRRMERIVPQAIRDFILMWENLSGEIIWSAPYQRYGKWWQLPLRVTPRGFRIAGRPRLAE